VGLRDCLELGRGLRERDVKTTISFGHALEQELHRERRLARARFTIQKVEMVRRQTTTEDVVEPRYPSSCPGHFGLRLDTWFSHHWWFPLL
jgi:hypothetical protein